MRRPDEREYAHEKLGDDFGAALDAYDTARRLRRGLGCGGRVRAS